MSDTVIEVDDLWKKYRLGVLGTGSLRHDLNRWWHRALGKPDPYAVVGDDKKRGTGNGTNGEPDGSELSSDEMWALRGVSFKVRRGEILGVIGRNGAGKSTLLKILSRVTAPTRGEIRARGRIASLLEVGTGFHPDLSGRENIFLNGAILGMTKPEIRGKLDEIIAFAEIEKFMDTPVKRYSSGMYVRLAFAVAAHLEPEILIVDEVLAVGDAQFQKKCLGKMKEVSSRNARTVLFVSHNMAAVKALCDRGILMDGGKIAVDDEIGTVVGRYLEGPLMKESAREWPDAATAPGNDHVRVEHIRVRPPDGEMAITVDTGARLEVGFYNLRANINLDCTIYIVNAEGVMMFESGCIVSADNDSKVGGYQVVGTIPGHVLNAGRYYMNVHFGKDQQYVLFGVDEVVSFDVANTNTGRGLNMHLAPGVVRPLLDWRWSFTNQCPGR